MPSARHCPSPFYYPRRTSFIHLLLCSHRPEGDVPGTRSVRKEGVTTLNHVSRRACSRQNDARVTFAARPARTGARPRGRRSKPADPVPAAALSCRSRPYPSSEKTRPCRLPGPFRCTSCTLSPARGSLLRRRAFDSRRTVAAGDIVRSGGECLCCWGDRHLSTRVRPEKYSRG